MKCPICEVDLMITDRQGIEIDYCPKCRGIWLDRGELDKLVERLAQAQPQANPYPQTKRDHYREEHSPVVYPDERYTQSHDRRGHHGRRRKSFLEDIFDFD